MKKGILITAGVIALLAIMVWADRKFPPASAPAAGMGTPNTPTDAPTIALKDLKDQDVTMAQYKGKVVLVNFWATWCAPCKVEIPWMIEFQQKYAARGFTILGVSMDEEGKKVVQPFLDKERFDVNGQKEAMNYPILFGDDSIGEKFGGIMGLPTSMLFNRDGKKIRTIVGLVNHDDISKVIEGML
jgi:thiol-disulfide isomerase/thioredoxin